MYTRKQYMNKECTHHEYYSQFVDEGQKNKIKSRIGLDRILSYKDEHLNDIPLKEWDNIPVHSPVASMLKEAGDYLTLANQVCINKAAARMLQEENNNEN